MGPLAEPMASADVANINANTSGAIRLNRLKIAGGCLNLVTLPLIVHCCVVVLLGFGWWNVADGFQQAAVIDPVDPFQCGELDGFKVAPRPARLR